MPLCVVVPRTGELKGAALLLEAVVPIAGRLVDRAESPGVTYVLRTELGHCRVGEWTNVRAGP